MSRAFIEPRLSRGLLFPKSYSTLDFDNLRSLFFSLEEAVLDLWFVVSWNGFQHLTEFISFFFMS